MREPGPVRHAPEAVELGPVATLGKVSHDIIMADQGILGNADQGGQRQVTVIEREAWDAMMDQLQGDIEPAARRANLLVTGVPLANSRDRILRVGDCRIRIQGETRPCERMDEALPGLRRAMAEPWRGGAFGVVLDDGLIRVGDPVRLTDPD